MEQRNNSPRPPAYQQAKLPLYSPAILFSQLKCSAEPVTVMARGAEEQENASGQCSTFDVPASSLLLSCCPRGRAGTGAGRSRCSSGAVFPEAGSLSRRHPQCTSWRVTQFSREPGLTASLHPGPAWPLCPCHLDQVWLTQVGTT